MEFWLLKVPSFVDSKLSAIAADPSQADPVIGALEIVKEGDKPMKVVRLWILEKKRWEGLKYLSVL